MDDFRGFIHSGRLVFEVAKTALKWAAFLVFWRNLSMVAPMTPTTP